VVGRINYFLLADYQQHGVSRVSAREQKAAKAREKELKEIKEYQDLIELVNSKVISDLLS
jgi:hypothetical protein